MLFSGEYEHTLDDKCRFIVPIRFRERLEEGCVITRGFDGCLWIFPQPDYDRLMTQIQTLNQFNRSARQLFRLLTGHDLRLDKQGRILIPPALRAHADIAPDSEIVIVGINSDTPHLEVWNKARWDGVQNDLGENSQTMGEELAGLGFSLR